jgi:putative ABC transport system substrate-binding protein
MRRRDFITLFGGAAAAWPLGARAQQPAMPVIGVLSGVAFEPYADRITAFRQGLESAGFVEGGNIIIEYRSADGHGERLPELAADLVSRGVAVIVAVGSGIDSPWPASTTIPIVFAVGADPVVAGYVKSLNHPGANVTGVSFLPDALGGKRLGFLHELVPNAATVGFLMNSRLMTKQQSTSDENEMVTAGRTLGIPIVVLDAADEKEIDAAFDTIDQRQIKALVVQNDAYLNTRRDQIAALAIRHVIPTIFAYREHVAAGGLMSYGTDVNAMYRLAGVYAARILKGEKPGDLPVQLASTFKFIINLKTAKALGLTVPASLLATADEVIE